MAYSLQATMGTRDARVDTYIAGSAEWARPILTHLRQVVHAGCPDVAETLKWGWPHFMYEGMLCSMAAFRAHCTFGFWKGPLVVRQPAQMGPAMGQFGRITRPSDLPSRRRLVGYVKKAARLNERGVKAPRGSKARQRRRLRVPVDLSARLDRNAAARATFEGFSPARRREYLEWIADAKGADTRRRRLETAVEWMAEGKPHNWRYESRRASSSDRRRTIAGMSRGSRSVPKGQAV